MKGMSSSLMGEDRISQMYQAVYIILTREVPFSQNSPSSKITIRSIQDDLACGGLLYLNSCKFEQTQEGVGLVFRQYLSEASAMSHRKRGPILALSSFPPEFYLDCKDLKESFFPLQSARDFLFRVIKVWQKLIHMCLIYL